MDTGKLVRLNRLFSHPSGRLCSIAVDHWVNYDQDMPPGLRHLRQTLPAIVAARPDAITMHKGMAASFWQQYAGAIPFILQGFNVRPDDAVHEVMATPLDAVRLGADAYAICGFVRGPTEGFYLKLLSEAVRAAEPYDMPVICHTYPRTFAGGKAAVSHTPEDVAWAVRCAVEVGVDVVKVPFTGDAASYADIIADCPRPIVAAGGPRTSSLQEALAAMAEAVRGGARGATIGRNAWGFPNVTGAVRAFMAVIHDGVSPADALAAAGL